MQTEQSSGPNTPAVVSVLISFQSKSVLHTRLSFEHHVHCEDPQKIRNTVCGNPRISPNGAWVQGEVCGERVHVYSNSTFMKIMLLDSCITKCTYLFIIFYLN